MPVRKDIFLKKSVFLFWCTCCQSNDGASVKVCLCLSRWGRWACQGPEGDTRADGPPWTAWAKGWPWLKGVSRFFRRAGDKGKPLQPFQPAGILLFPQMGEFTITGAQHCHELQQVSWMCVLSALREQIPPPRPKMSLRPLVHLQEIKKTKKKQADAALFPPQTSNVAFSNICDLKE